MTSETAEQPPERAVLRVSRGVLLGVGLALLGAAPLAAAAPAMLGWVLLLPLLAGAWALWVRTEADETGLVVRRLSGRRGISWSEVAGLRFPRRSWARAVLTDGREVALPAVGFNELPELSAASGGRLTDPFDAARTARERRETDEPT